MPFRRGAKTIYRREKKESGVKCNGSHPITVKTIHGQITFPLQKYLINGKSCHYFQLTYQLRSEYISPLLQELLGYYSNRLSYKEVEKLVERISGKNYYSISHSYEVQ